MNINTRKGVTRLLTPFALLMMVICLLGAIVPDVVAAQAKPTTSMCPPEQVQHWDKIIFVITNRDFAAKLKLPWREPLDIKVLDDPNSVADIKGKVVDFLRKKYGVDVPRAAFDIQNVEYAILGCVATPAPSEHVAQQDFTVVCTSTGQLCSPSFSIPITTTSVLKVRYTTALSHCSSVRVRLLVDSVLKSTSGFLGWPGAPSPFSGLPLDTGIVDLGPVSTGPHSVSVQAEGQASGCNSGQLNSWGGKLEVITN